MDIVKHLGSSLLIALLVSACAKEAPPPTPPGAPAFKAEVVFFTGEVAIDGQAAEFGRPVAERFTVATGPASACEIIFNEKNIIRFQENTRAELDLSGPAKQMVLERGSMAAVLRRLDRSAVPGFRVKTKTASAGVRGTAFFVRVDDASTYICDCNGQLDVEDAAGGLEERLSTTRHGARLFTRENNVIKVARAGLLYHKDEDMNGLAEKIGYNIPWTGSGYGY